MTDGSNVDTATTKRERAGLGRVKLWFLWRADRILVAGVLTAAVFVAFVVAVAGLSPPFARQIESGDTIETMFSTMIAVIVTGTTLVVTIGQLVLTQENGPLGDQHERMSDAMEVREFTEELIGSPSPADPATFLDGIIGVTERRSRSLRESIGETGDDPHDEIDELAENVLANAASVRARLDGAQFGSFDVLYAALDYDYSWKIFQVERIATEYEGRLTEREQSMLDDLKTALSMFGPAREHVKTLYFQWALIDLSQLILYAAVPALVVAGVMLAVVDAGTVPGSTLGIDHVVVVVGGAFAVTLLPFMLFVSYILRILTVAKRTLAIEPLILDGEGR